MPKARVKEDRRVQVNLTLSKRLSGAFRRYVHDGGWTITGWVRRQIIEAAETQIQKEKGNV